ncbi:uncharacterized protein FOMMEDRAFT_142366 [Fomitiporia mediterranea MF3/22]|uniref:uncharacterized protein n=1 Tax=Fomitiporia mediterranea (strain MF3/22) TaxID=694068 RepID=UPI0004407D8D|nr:uncharacterized protein FOMMEDRAFT_142366 [Fomitiporia mediterranea MF3/22]EJD00456.1 hypothetical protein FOMMEDRAFT_142366 [Fomitiporia mediterranea MF3/22]
MFDFTRLLLAPEPLLLLVLQVVSSLAQSNTLVLNQSLTLDTANLATSTFSLPQSSTSWLFISVALCNGETLVSGGNEPRFFVTNNSAVTNPGPSSTDSDVFEIIPGGNGMGNFTLHGSSGGVFSITSGNARPILEVGISDTEPLHQHLNSLPLLGDTTANQVLLFSTSFSPITFEEPTYPNYTLPDANLTVPNPPTQTPNFTLLVGPTNSFPEFNYTTNAFVDGSPITGCALANRPGLTVNTGSNTGNVQTKLVLRDFNGWRTQWLAGGLDPLTNYTAFVLQDNTKVSGPINFVTKSASFSCPLVHSLPYCPLVSYAVALPPPQGQPGTEAYDATTLPNSISGPIVSYMSNFTTSLLTFACGRDWYSSIVGCPDCQAAYRTWLCTVQLPRCSEFPSNTSTSNVAAPRNKRSFWRRDDSAQTTFVAPALVEQNATGPVRNTSLPTFSGNWTQLLPCLETCNAVERACPPFLNFKCPIPRFNADESYAVGFIDGDAANPGGEWLVHGGTTGTAQDRWGNVWCNGPGLNN